LSFTESQRLDSSLSNPAPVLLTEDAPATQSPLAQSPFLREQQTLVGRAECSGVGVHSGKKTSLVLRPAPEDTGIVFIRTDLKGEERHIPARYDHVVETQLCTTIGNSAGVKVSTIEHLMAALAAAGIDNAFIEIDGPEVPIMDGSSDPFLFLIEAVGLAAQTSPRRYLKIEKTINVPTQNAKDPHAAEKHVRLSPAAEQRFSFDIQFRHTAISRQRYDLVLTAGHFKAEIARARTFGFMEEVEQLRAHGFARGGSLDNAIVIKDNKVMNQDGLRYQNEFVRHKLLDAVGDLALAGMPILGHFEGFCSGHALNNQLLRAVFADKANYSIISF
jgi:UDP-3-O-[3-hydroxymyristoyl] N-acetylglucosamine deacetylase